MKRRFAAKLQKCFVGTSPDSPSARRQVDNNLIYIFGEFKSRMRVQPLELLKII